MHPAVIRARQWWANASRSERMLSGRERESVLVRVHGNSECEVVGAAHWTNVYAVPVAGGQVLRFNGTRWVSARIQCGPLAKEAPAPCAHISSAYLRDLARQAPEFRDAWKMDEVGRALVNAADLIDRLMRKEGV